MHCVYTYTVVIHCVVIRNVVISILRFMSLCVCSSLISFLIVSCSFCSSFHVDLYCLCFCLTLFYDWLFLSFFLLVMIVLKRMKMKMMMNFQKNLQIHQTMILVPLCDASYVCF